MNSWSNRMAILLTVAILFISTSLMAQETAPTNQSGEAATSEMTQGKQPSQLTPSASEETEPYIESEDDFMYELEGGAKDQEIGERSGHVNFKGFLKERGTRKPLSYITVYLKNTPYEATTDKKGYFEFSDLPPSEYIPVVPTVAYDKFETTETIQENELVEVVYYLEPKVYGTLEVVVRGKKEKKEVSRKVLAIEEAKVIPGSRGDAVQVVENLPGVARGSASTAGIVIRGSGPEDSRVLLDGVQIPILFHFGGIKSVYNSDLLDEINLYTGGFGTQYGNATGGIVELKSKAPRNDRWGGYVDTSLIDATALAEGPITDKLSLALALRRSILDLVFPFVLPSIIPPEELEFITFPVYYDYQAKLDFKLNKEHRFVFDAYGAIDELKLLSNVVNDTEPDFTGEIGFRTIFSNFVGRHIYTTDALKTETIAAFTFTELKAFFGNNYFFKLQAFGFDIQENIKLQVNKNHTLGIGVQLMPGTGIVESNLIRPPKEGDVGFSFANSEKIESDVTAFDSMIDAYINDEIKFGKWLLIPGIRFNYSTAINDYAVSPRATIRYQIIEPVTLKAAAGLYHRVPDPDEIYEPYGNDGLTYERAVHVIGGVEWDILDYLSLDVQGFYKRLDRLVSRAEDYGDSSENDSEDAYKSDAEGYVVGAELLLRHNFANNFFGWISYSFSQSRRNDGPGTDYRFFDLDQTHNLILVASYKFLKTWQIGGRFQVTSGEPYTDVKGGIYNADNGTYLPIYDQNNKNGERIGLYHRLDIRLDKRWIFDTWVLDTYLDIQNVYFNANPVQNVYNYDYTERGELTGIPILPSIGIKAEF